jgi:general secretion pathway protein F
MSLDDLVLLNDEIASLVRAGVPLELGLSSWGGDLSGPLRQTAVTLGESVSQGRSLSDALDDDSLNIPLTYRAVVTAGLRSGRLPAALESLTETARHVHQLRNAVVLAMIYPLLLVTLAYGLFLLLITLVLPVITAAYESHPPGYLLLLQRWAQLATASLPIPFTELGLPVALLPPLLLWTAVVAWWRRSQRALVLSAGRAAGLWRWLPIAGRIVECARSASLAEIFGLLIDHDVPLPDAVRLAATCTNESQLTKNAADAARRIEAGERGTPEKLQAAGLPPVLALMVSNGARQQTLVSLARHAAENGRSRVEQDIAWLRDWLPVWLIVTVGSVIGVVYCLTFFVPFSQLMQAFGQSLSSSVRIHP